MNFIDSTRIYVKGGNGGNGCIAFLREKYRPKGGPSGGDGGHGGNIILQVDSNLSTLQDLAYKKQYIASNGQHGRGNNMHGKNGCDIVINVPPGTIVKDVKNNVIIIDLKEVNQLYLIAKGGNGGLVGIEVKATKMAQFHNIHITSNEWETAKKMGKNYHLYLVADCKNKRAT